jgi:hypothetical protein
MSTTPTHDTPLPGSSSQDHVTSLPNLEDHSPPDTIPLASDSTTEKSPMSSDYVPSNLEGSATEESRPSSPGSSQDYVPSRLEYSLSSDNHPLSWGSATEEYYPSSPGSSQDYVPSRLEDVSSDSHPLSWGSAKEESHPSSPGSSQDYVPSEPEDVSSDSHPLSWSSATEESHPPTPASTDSHPLPPSPSNPGPSTERNPPPSAKRPRPEEHEPWSSVSKIFKGKIKRRFSGSGALNVARGNLRGTFNSRAYVTTSPLCQQMTAVTTF